jgi:hypothetical protein
LEVVLTIGAMVAEALWARAALCLMGFFVIATEGRLRSSRMLVPYRTLFANKDKASPQAPQHLLKVSVCRIRWRQVKRNPP